MPKSRIIVVIGLFIALLPILGFPHAWESFFEIVGGLGIVFLSVLIAVDRRLLLKSKAEKRLRRRRERSVSEVHSPSGMPDNEEASI